jgi:Domain of unknown function (DUF4157)
MNTYSPTQTPTTPKRSFTPVPKGLLQRKCACGSSAGLTGKCGGCDREKLTLQRRTSDRATPDEVPPIVHEVLNSSGQPLDRDTRTFMESRFGQDFSQVRVHTDAKASESAQAVNALAYTVSQNIVFESGQYAPTRIMGKMLLAHELVHTLQQSKVGAVTHSQANDYLETEADTIANKAISSSDQIDSQTNRIEPFLQKQSTGSVSPPTIYMCSKNLERSPIGKHAFFRIGGSGKGNSTRSLEPVDRGGDCWQGEAMYDFPADVSADADCEAISITESCLNSQFTAYSIGHYCTLGPNSNTFVGTLARNCGVRNPDPPGFTPGIGDPSPPSGTFASSPNATLLSCSQKICDASREVPPEEIPA